MKSEFQSILDQKLKTPSIEFESAKSSFADPQLSLLLGKLPQHTIKSFHRTSKAYASQTRSAFSEAEASNHSTAEKESNFKSQIGQKAKAASDHKPDKQSDKTSDKLAKTRSRRPLNQKEQEAFKTLNQLGADLNEEFTIHQLKAAGRKLFKVHHPDLGGNSVQFITIKEAQNRLMAFLNSEENSSHEI